ncbi:MAG TPA: OsmC family peroxiredoxin [Acidimicrobiia bacterium]
MESRARTVWRGDLATGTGQTTLASGAASPLEVTWASRTEAANGRTSPEELIAAAHASCYCMALSAGLTRAGFPPGQLEAEAAVTFERIDGNWTVTSSRLSVQASVPGITEDAFQEAAENAKVGCPVSRALTGNVEITLEARLT